MSVPALVKPNWLLTTFKYTSLFTGIYLFRKHVCDIIAIEGDSMKPTLNESGDLVVLDRLTGYSNYEPGDIVILRSPEDPNLFLCKRVIGVAGQQVIIPTKHHELSPISYESVLVPFGHAWIAGDNKENSEDSRKFGPVCTGLFEGRVVGRVFPFAERKQFGSILPSSIRALTMFNSSSNNA